MFTRKELNVLQGALRAWNGPYQGEELEPEEKLYKKESLEIANSLAKRFEEILWQYYEMERSYLFPEKYR